MSSFFDHLYIKSYTLVLTSCRCITYLRQYTQKSNAMLKIARHIAALFVLHLRNTRFFVLESHGVARDRVSALDTKHRLGSEMSCVTAEDASVYRLTTTATRRRRTSSWKADLNREGGKPRRLP